MYAYPIQEGFFSSAHQTDGEFFTFRLSTPAMILVERITRLNRAIVSRKDICEMYVCLFPH